MRRKQTNDGNKVEILPNKVRPVGADRSDEDAFGVTPEEIIDNSDNNSQEVRTDNVLSETDKEKPKSAFERIITYQFKSIDEEEEYKEIEEWLSFKKRVSGMSYGELVDALDQAQDYAFRSVQLKARWHLHSEEFERDNRITEAPIRRAAIDSLNLQKKKLKEETGLAGKTISDLDVEHEMAVLFPDEWILVKTRRIQGEQSVKIVDALAERCSERARDLRQMVYSSRAAD